MRTHCLRNARLEVHSGNISARKYLRKKSSNKNKQTKNQQQHTHTPETEILLNNHSILSWRWAVLYIRNTHTHTHTHTYIYIYIYIYIQFSLLTMSTVWILLKIVHYLPRWQAYPNLPPGQLVQFFVVTSHVAEGGQFWSYREQS